MAEHPAWTGKTARFELRNASDAAISVVRVRTSCGCATAALSVERIAGGEKADLTVEIKPNTLRGPYTKHVFVHWREGDAEDARSGVLRLTVRGNARPLLTVRPGEVVALGEVRVGEAVRRELRIEAGPREFALGRPDPAGELVAEFGDGRLAAGGRMPLAVVFRARKAGRFRCVLSLPVLSPEGHPPVGIVVHGTAVGGDGR